MIEVIFGEKGTGKTKHIIDMANSQAKSSRGSMIFIDDDNSYMFDLNSNIRFINAQEYVIATPKTLYGFLAGLAASDFDLEHIYIDGLWSFVHRELDTLEDLFDKIEKLTKARGIHLVISLSSTAEKLPSFMQKYVIRNT